MMKKFLSMLILILLLSGCTAPGEDLRKRIDEQAAEIQNLKAANEALQAQITAQTPQSADLLATAQDVVKRLKDKDMGGLAFYIHPQKGVRFSPYAYVNPEKDLTFSPQQIETLLKDPAVYTWGAFDGTGDPIRLTFADYYRRFVYDEDFVNPHIIGNNMQIGSGNSINNIAQIYPDASFVEFHFKGFDPQYGGMDWASLRLIFEQVEGRWMLVGIQHDGWTI